MALFIHDFGNARGKWFNPKTGLYGDYEHAVASLSEDKWKQIVGKGKPPAGYIKVNGQGYAIGAAARRHTISRKPEGAARYTDRYYAPAALHAMVEGIGRSATVTLYASHAPQDVTYAEDLVNIMRQAWTVESHEGTLTFDVNRVETFDEPLGGYANYVFNADGTERKRNPVAEKTVLLLDVGGFTTDQVAVDPGGHIDAGSLRSTRVGSISALERFTEDLRNHNKEFFRTAGDLDIRRVETGIITGVYPFGNQPIPCQTEAAEAIQQLVNSVIDIINSVGGAANFDVILLTGGGSALIYNTLCQSFPMISFIMVEEKATMMKFANVFGGGKIAALMRKVRS